jgi:uncharacterized protein YebE (UPF0316 family)
MLAILLSPSAWLGALGIFALRFADMTFDTLRVLFVMRGRKGLAWVLGFFQAAIFVIAITSVLSNLDNPLNFVGYAAGFATGNVVGMLIEERLAVGHIHLQIISPRLGARLAQELRRAGFAVTEIPARGKDGTVSLLSCSVLRKDVGKVEAIIHAADAEAFVTSEDVRPVRRGFWRA